MHSALDWRPLLQLVGGEKVAKAPQDASCRPPLRSATMTAGQLLAHTDGQMGARCIVHLP